MITIFFSVCSLFMTVCDPCHPDTPDNRKAFRHITGAEPGKGIRELYADAEETPFSTHKYWFAFEADRQKMEQLLKRYDLRSVPPEESAGTVPDTKWSWWDKTERFGAEHYQHQKFSNGDLAGSCHLWFQPETKKCQLAVICY